MTQSPRFEGLAVALATPFRSDGALDLERFRKLVAHVAGGGADVLVPLGTTGEATTLEDAERDRVLEACLEEARGRTVVAGTGSNATATTARWTRRAQELGAHGALVVTPYYNKPTPSGLVAHFRAVCDAAPGLPVIAYNVPGRTGLNLLPSTLAKLWEIPSVVAVKESSGNLAQIGEIARALPRGKTLLAGDDNLALPSIALGATGLVSVIANLLPRETRAFVDAARAGDLERARRLHHALRPLMDALFLESSPIPLKAALELCGLAGSTLRLPLTPASDATRAALAQALAFARDEARC